MQPGAKFACMHKIYIVALLTAHGLPSRRWSWMSWLLLVFWLWREGHCPQGTCRLKAELWLYFLLDGHLSSWRVTNYSAASRTVELNQAWSPHSFYFSVVMGLPIKSLLQIFPHICFWATAEVHMCLWTILKCWRKVLLKLTNPDSQRSLSAPSCTQAAVGLGFVRTLQLEVGAEMYPKSGSALPGCILFVPV